MARNDKLSPGIQVFRGSRPRQDVFSANAGIGCCGTSTSVDYDKLAERTRFDNGLAHSNPTGGNDKFVFPYGDGFADTRDNIVNFINTNGVGAHISVLAIPTYAFVTGVGVHIEGAESGLTFDLVTRNGLVLPGSVPGVNQNVVGQSLVAGATAVTGTAGHTVLEQGFVKVVTATVDGCEVVRTVEDGDKDSFKGFGVLGSASFIDIFGRASNGGSFSLEADEIALKVASMPASGKINGSFNITVAVSYDVIQRAEF